MRIRLLGPVELFDGDGAAAAIAAPKRRAVLAVLALELNRVVPVDRLLYLVWDGSPPPRARTALQGHISALRRLLAETGGGLTLVTRHPGYTLLGTAADVDLHQIRALREQAARTDDDRAAVELLNRALALWRGRPLADLPGSALREGVAADLVRTRPAMLEAWAERKVRLSQGDETLVVLEDAVREEPFREPLVRLLLLALHQAGRQADATTLFHRTRHLLGTELGLDPGPALQAAYETVLRGAPVGRAKPTTPAQLPREIAGFVGREAELRALDAVCGTHREPERPAASGLALVVGPAGVGKTALALRWAHRGSRGFPDGQLFADLRGFSAAPSVTAASVLFGFLNGLGVPESEIPADADRRIALYRSLLAERRVLVVLDNVRDLADVLTLLPSGRGCAAVVTSRNLLGGLMAGPGAEVLRVGALAVEQSRDVLAGAAGRARIVAEADAAGELVRLCEGLPLALRVAGARLAAHPDWTVADLVEDLSDEHARLSGLSTDDADIGVEAALHLSYRALPESAAELFRLLGLYRGPEVNQWTAAALTGRAPADARRALTTLASAHLLYEPGPGRFARHDLVRLYTEQLADQGLPAETRDAAHRRLLDYYLATSAAAAEPAIAQKQLLHRPRSAPTVHVPAVTGSAEAPAQWFRTEAAAIRALVAACADGPSAGQAWRLACNTMPLYFGTEHVDDWVAASLSGLRAAEAAGELPGRSRMHSEVGMALEERGEHAEALRHLERAVELARESGDCGSHYLALFRLGIGQLGAGSVERATETTAAALREARELGDLPAQAQCLNNLGHAHNLLGDHGKALDCAEQARDLTAGAPASHTHIASLCTVTEALQGLGRTVQAVGFAREAARLCREYGNSAFEAQALHLLGRLQRDLGRPTEAAESLRQSRDLAAPLGRAEGGVI
jgi:DNA-binding SARP family transcriptional activator/tetratricopeptide (TPR) repeat protein